MPGKSQKFLITGPSRSACTIVLAHGAGAPMDSPFMNKIADGLAEQQLRVVRFEFPYMDERRQTGKPKPPNRQPVLLETWMNVIQAQNSTPLLIGGKSMGGRMASMIADETDVDGVICLGYPFHPTGKPDKLRIDHLREIQTPTMILQGERDPFGKRAEVLSYPLGRNVTIQWVPDGDHSFKPRVSSGHSLEANLEMAISKIAEFSGSRSK